MSRICRHNRFLAECPICSKGTVLDPGRHAERARRGGGSRGGGKPARAAAPAATGPFGVAGPYGGDDGQHEVRLERVPGGLRLAVWAAGSIQRRAPVLAAADLPGLLSSAVESGALEHGAIEAPSTPLTAGSSAGRAGDLRDELRVEPLEEGRVRIARWVLRPSRGWELQETPVLLPAQRFVEALASGSAGRPRPA